MSAYKLFKPGVCEFINANNQNIRHWLTIIDNKTLAPSKPDTDPPSTYLKLFEMTEMPNIKEADKNWQATAEKYMALTNSDPDNIQSWSACATTALTYSLQLENEANEIAKMNKESLKLMLKNPNVSPCPEVILF